MLRDKMNFIKSNEAYIAHVNSIKESMHDIKQLDLKLLAESFLMYKVPYLNELK